MLSRRENRKHEKWCQAQNHRVLWSPVFGHVLLGSYFSLFCQPTKGKAVLTKHSVMTNRKRRLNAGWSCWEERQRNLEISKSIFSVLKRGLDLNRRQEVDISPAQDVAPASRVWAPVCPLRWPDKVKTVWNLFPEKKQSLWLIPYFQPFPFSQHVKFIFPGVHYFLSLITKGRGTNVSLEYLPSCQGIDNKVPGKMFLLGVSRNKSAWMEMSRNHISKPILDF